MSTGGYQCKVRLATPERDLQPIGPWRLVEDLREGSVLEFRIPVEDAPSLSPGDELSLELEEEHRHQLTLWISRIARQRSRTGDMIWIKACDPLSHCRGLPRFCSFAGQVSLRSIAARVLADQAGHLATQPAAASEFPDWSHPWLIQAEEDGAEFLHRIALNLEHVIYWDRDQLRCDPFAEVRSDTVAIEPDPDRDCRDWSIVTGLPAAAGQLWWTDPASRATRSSAFGSGTASAHQRVVSLYSPAVSAGRGSDGSLLRGQYLQLTGALFRARPGAPLRFGPDGDWGVERCDHEFMGAGSYLSTVFAVPAARWGLSTARVAGGQIGPYQAVVTHNHDPEGLGRLRVRLCEDPEERSSPFLPLLTLAGGQDMGASWLPEVGELVMVAADRRCPEAMICLGALRGAATAVPTSWRHDDNRYKALFTRNGIGIIVDDQEKVLSLVTPDARIEIGRAGEIIATSKQFRLDSEGRIELDATRIDLG